MALTSPSRISKSNPHKKHKSTHRSSPPPIKKSSAPLLPLEIFLSNAFFDLLVQDQDDIAELTYERNWSQHVKETGNGRPFTFQSFRKFIFQTRSEVSNRQLLSQSFVVQPSSDDDGREGKTGTVAHVVKLSGLKEGREVMVDIVAVLQIEWDKERERRQVVTESFVLALR